MVHTTSGPVEVSVPATVTDLDLLGRVDYQDAYQVETAHERTPEQWMRAFIEGAPRWFTVPWIVGLGGVLLGADPRIVREPGHVMGWKILRDEPDAFVVGLDTPRGLNARLIAQAPSGRAVIATQIRLDTGYAQRLWPAIRPGHRYFAPYLLGRASKP
jgi:hypothetical protein